MINLNISSLEFDDIKNDIKDYFKQDQQWTDYNFEGSAMSSYLNILAYNTHYTGYYVKMMLNEGFADTAQTREAMLSKAKRGGYIVKSKTSAYASVSVEVKNVDPDVSFVNIPRGTVFNTKSSTDNRNVFCTTTDYIIKRDSANNFKLNDVVINQGAIVKNSFLIKESKQRIRLSDQNCDVNSIRVYLKTSENTTIRTQLSRVDDIIDIQPDSKVWYVVMSSSGLYDIYFGEDKFGYQPHVGEYIDVEFISSNGTAGNNIQQFIISPTTSTNNTNIGYYSDFVITTIEPSHGGSDAETVEELRFAIPNHTRRQKRVVNETDYRGVLLTEFRDIDSISVWGGEKNSERMYAKMLISIKPKNSDNLSETAKQQIRTKLVKRYGIVGSDVVFIKPEFLNLHMIIVVKASKFSNLPTDQIESILTQRANEYNKTILNKFEQVYSDTDFISFLREDADFISSIYTQKMLNKKVVFDKGTNTRYHVVIGNPISSIVSDTFEYGLYKAYFKNEGEYVYIFNSDTDEKLTVSPSGSVDLETGNAYLDIPRDVTNTFINVTCEPKTPDIETQLNNIVRFTSINVKVV